MAVDSRTGSPRSRAHGFSALSTSVGVALTLMVLGAMMSLAMVVGDLRAEWMSSLRVEVALDREDTRNPDTWLDQWADYRH